MMQLPSCIRCGNSLRRCTFILALFSAVLAIAGIITNIVAFFYFVTYCKNNETEENFCYIFLDVVPKLDADSAPKFASLFMVYTCVYLYGAILAYIAAKQKSHENLRLAFIIVVILWIIGTMIFLVILEHYILVYAYIAVYSFKIYEMYVYKQFMDELHNQGFDRYYYIMIYFSILYPEIHQHHSHQIKINPLKYIRYSFKVGCCLMRSA